MVYSIQDFEIFVRGALASPSFLRGAQSNNIVFIPSRLLCFSFTPRDDPQKILSQHVEVILETILTRESLACSKLSNFHVENLISLCKQRRTNDDAPWSKSSSIIFQEMDFISSLHGQISLIFPRRILELSLSPNESLLLSKCYPSNRSLQDSFSLLTQPLTFI